MSASDTANLLRLHTAGFEGLIFVIGPLLAGWHATAAGLVCLWFIGVLVNGHIFALNDVVDLPYDRDNPARSRSPLVAGRISERAALSLAIVLPFMATAIVVAAGWGTVSALAFVLMLILATLVNIYQKVMHHPILMDLLYSTTMAAPLPVSAYAYQHSVTQLVWSATVTLFLLALELNSIAGNLKDLRSDLETGFRTVAVSLGARINEDARLVPGRCYQAYCWTVHAGASVSAGITVGLAVAPHEPGIATAVAIIGAVVTAGGTRDLARLLTGRRSPSKSGREYYFAAGFALLIGAVGLRSEQIPFWTAMAALASWEVIARLSRRRRSRRGITRWVSAQ